MLESLITSKTRIKLLLKFFLNPNTNAYLRGLAEELGENTNAIRVELNRLADANLLEYSNSGRTKLYKANIKHSLFPELHSAVKKYIGLDQVVDNILTQLGEIDFAFITGDYAKGIDSGIIDLVIVGRIDNLEYLHELVNKAEQTIHRKIRLLVLNIDEYKNLQKNFDEKKYLVVWLKQGVKLLEKE